MKPHFARRSFLVRALSFTLLLSAALTPDLGVFPCPLYAANDSDLTLRYSKPADLGSWANQMLPIGNGRLGAMISGVTALDRIQFNEISLWSGDDTKKGAYQPFGDVFISLPGHDKEITSYTRELDLALGEVRTAYKKGGVTYQRQYIASHPAEVMVVRLTADKPGNYTGEISLTDMHKAELKGEKNRLTCAGTMNGYIHQQGPWVKEHSLPSTSGLDYESQLLVRNEGGTLEIKDSKISFANCDALTLYMGAVTSYVTDPAKKFIGDKPHPRLTAQIDAASEKPFAALLAEHRKDYTSLFDRVTLSLGETPADRRALTTDQRLNQYTKTGGDPGLEVQFFQMGRYLLMGSSRGILPANLQGLWNDRINPAWDCDYHTNINIQMCYWHAETTNLSDLTLPFFSFTEALLPGARAHTYQHLRKPDGERSGGWTLHTSHNIFGFPDYVWNKTANAWFAQHFWEHYAFTQDKVFLKDRAYPLMKEVCEFWQGMLKTLPDGRLVAPKGWSPEHGPTEDGVSYDQEILWDLFNNTVEAADTLGIDKEFRDKVAAMRDKLVLPKIGKWGQLQEWMEDRDDPNDIHRHVSHLFGVYPGRRIAPTTTPELAEAARKSLAARGNSGTGWSMAWKICFWARLGDADHAYDMLRGLLAYPGTRGRQLKAEREARGTPVKDQDFDNGGGTMHSLLSAHPPFQMDGNSGGTAAIAEMLLQSQTGEIILLPALPAAWPTGSFTGLQARGGFSIDAVWAGGKLTSATIHCIAGSGQCKLRYGTKVFPLNLKPGASLTVTQDMLSGAP